MSALAWVGLASIVWILVLVVAVSIMATRGEREGLRGPTVEHEPKLTEEERDRIEAEARAFRVALRRVSPEDFDEGDEDVRV